MKQYFLLFGIIGLILFSCEKKDDIDNGKDDIDNGNDDIDNGNDNNVEISLDSLELIVSNLPNGGYRDLVLINENTGYALSSNFVAKTTDGGYTWISYPIPIAHPIAPMKIQFTDSQTGYIIAGENNLGILLKTTDGGQNWNTIDLNTYECPIGMFFLNNDIGFITGKGLFVKTLDGGRTWINLKKEHTFMYLGVNFKNDKEGIVTALNGEYFKTTDGGETWNNYNTVDYLTHNIYFVEDNVFVSRNGDPCLFDLTNNKGIVSLPINPTFAFFNSKQSIAVGEHWEELGYFSYNNICVTNDGWKTYSRKILSSTISGSLIAKMSDNKVMIIYSSLSDTYIMTLKKWELR